MTLQRLFRSIITIIAASCLIFWSVMPADKANALSESSPSNADLESEEVSEKSFMPVIELTAGAALVLETGRQRVLFEKSSQAIMEIPAASKLMTMLIACERLPLDTMVTISSVASAKRDAASSPDDVVLETGDKYPLEYLLLRLLFYNSDAAAIAIAEQVANEESRFVELMNSRAESYGMTSTVFANSTGEPVYETDTEDGLGVPNYQLSQYTTAADLSRLLQAGLQNQTFSSMLSQSSEYIVLDGQRLIPMKNQIQAIWTLSEGSITGAFYAERAGRSTVLTVGKADDINIITIVVNASDDNRYEDTLKLYDETADNYELSPLVRAGDIYAENFEQTIDGETFGLIYKKTLFYVHPRNDDFLKPNIQYRTYGPHSRPIQRSMVVGQVIFELKDGTTIAVEVGPDRQILSTITILDRALDQLQNNQNLTKVIIASILGLIVVLLIQLVKRFREFVHLLILVRLDKKSRHQ